MERIKQNRAVYDLALCLPIIPSIAIHKNNIEINKLPHRSWEEIDSRYISNGVERINLLCESIRTIIGISGLIIPEARDTCIWGYSLFTFVIIYLNRTSENQLKNYPRDRK